MRKIPVFASIARAYAFGLGGFDRALGVAWLPYLLVLVSGWFLLAEPARGLPGDLAALLPELLREASEIGGEETARRILTGLLVSYGEFYRLAIVFFLLNLFLQSAAAIGLTRVSMGLDTNIASANFWLGASVWKLFGAWFATYLIVYAANVVLVFAFIIVVVVAVAVLADVSVSAAIAICVAAFLTILALAAYISIRLNFFLPPLIVSEKKLDLLRSWTLSKGNVWRILAIYVSLVPPLVALAMIAGAAKVIAFFVLLPNWVGAIRERLSALADWNAFSILAQDALPRLPPLIAASFLLYVLFSAMLYAATARAYRGIVATGIASQTERG
ncbi:MAG: hypothetical protein ACT4OG_08025 [Alphaproteobacteria bacterium]